MKGRKFWIAALILFAGLTIIVAALAQELKKIDGDVGWVTLDKKAMTLVREGKHLADIELTQDTVFKIMEEQKAGAAGGKKKAKGEAAEEKKEVVKEEKEGGKKEGQPSVTTICYTIKPASVNDILSGWKANVTYAEQGKKKIAKEVVLTPVVFSSDEED